MAMGAWSYIMILKSLYKNKNKKLWECVFNVNATFLYFDMPTYYRLKRSEGKIPIWLIVHIGSFIFWIISFGIIAY